jgi:hypothetical protein
MDHMTVLTGSSLDPFTFRATLDPYRIQQLPDFMIHSKATSDLVIQRSVFAPGAGPRHTHPGPSFVYVIEGEIKLEKHNSEMAARRLRCTAPATPISRWPTRFTGRLS